MAAEVTRGPGFKNWLAWCEGHQDGYRGSRPSAESWAARHNAAHHEEGSK